MPPSGNLQRILAIGWLLATTVLLCLPGSNLPQPGGNWFEQLYMDKWIHIFIFALLTWLWCRVMGQSGHSPAYDSREAAVTGAATNKRSFAKRLLGVAILCCIYGIAMEFVQKWLIPMRGFEVWDIAADAAGCITGWWLAQRRYNKRQLAADDFGDER